MSAKISIADERTGKVGLTVQISRHSLPADETLLIKPCQKKIVKRLMIKVPVELYHHVTGHVEEQIFMYLTDAARHEAEAAAMRERAYGLYLGWRTFAVEMTNPSQFHSDDMRFENLLRMP